MFSKSCLILFMLNLLCNLIKVNRIDFAVVFFREPRYRNWKSGLVAYGIVALHFSSTADNGWFLSPNYSLSRRLSCFTETNFHANFFTGNLFTPEGIGRRADKESVGVFKKSLGREIHRMKGLLSRVKATNFS